MTFQTTRYIRNKINLFSFCPKPTIKDSFVFIIYYFLYWEWIWIILRVPPEPGKIRLSSVYLLYYREALNRVIQNDMLFCFFILNQSSKCWASASELTSLKQSSFNLNFSELMIRNLETLLLNIRTKPPKKISYLVPVFTL